MCKNGKNCGMDFVLFAILAFYFFRGCMKGLLSMIFSLVGVFFVAIVSWKLTTIFLPSVQNFAGGAIFDAMRSLFDGMLPGTFSSLAEFQSALMKSKVGALFSVFAAKLFENISFEGSLTTGQILAPTLSKIFVSVVTFLLIFLCLEILLKILKNLLNKIIKKCGLSMGNRILGGLVGLVKGVLMFGILFVLLSTIANVFLNENLLKFVQNGTISNFVYQKLIVKIIHLIY